jgi:hypothetical protein
VRQILEVNAAEGLREAGTIGAIWQPATDRLTLHKAVIHRDGKPLLPLAGSAVLAIGGEKSIGAPMATIMRFAAGDVQGYVFPCSEENPEVTVAVVRVFLSKPLPPR